MRNKTIIVNIVPDDKFIDGIINYNEHFSPSGVRHLYVFVTESHIDKFNYIKRYSDIQQLAQNCILPFLSESGTNAILLHTIYAMPLEIIPKIPKNICVVWSSWGYDIYSMMNTNLLINIDLFEPLTRESLHLPLFKEGKKSENKMYQKAVSRIDYISTVLPEEYKMIPIYDYFNAKPLHYTYITPGELEKYQQKEYSEKRAGNILIGNSGAPTNNHLDIFYRISKIDTGDKKIYCPLSYAAYPEEYKEKVVSEGYKLFGDNFVPMLQFMNKHEYFSIVSSCEYIFFGHIRQQALGNIREMLANGCKVFLNEMSPMYNHFKNRGIKVFSIQSDTTIEELTTSLPKEIAENNIECMKQYTSPLKLRNEMNVLVKTIRTHNSLWHKVLYSLHDFFNKKIQI